MEIGINLSLSKIFGASAAIVPDLPVAQNGPAGTVSIQNVIGGDVPYCYYPDQLSGQDMVYYAPYPALYAAAFK